jgi:uncharacterized repeat protein (TIGR03837 family)
MRGRSCDIFCRVVDNFGDAGVCWRLARQLSHEHGARVRLLIDEPAALAALDPAVDCTRSAQTVDGIGIALWNEAPAADSAERSELDAGPAPRRGPGYRAPRDPTPPAGPVPAEVVIEGFGCGLPEDYVAAMAARPRPPVWIVLEYLSAEPWVEQYHGKPSPHPKWGIDRYFFFPGFATGTGGLLRERDLIARRDAFAPAQRAALWKDVGFTAPPAQTQVLSLFAYRSAPLYALIARLEEEGPAVVVAMPAEPGAIALLTGLGIQNAQAPLAAKRGQGEIRVLPFLAQTRFDELLWTADINFVRGEDSFVRAQWAARPFVWNIYPQTADAHRLKLDAFLDRYCEGLASPAREALRALWHAWNGIAPHPPLGEAWTGFVKQEVVLTAHARGWAARLEKLPELAAELARFCADRLK